MLLSIFLRNYAYLCSVNKKKRVSNRLLKRRGLKKREEMLMMNRMNDESYRTLAMLRYQAEHYRLVGNGSMSQQINAEIRRLENSGRKITETQKN